MAFQKKEKEPQTDWRDDPRYSEEAIAQRQDSTKNFEQFEQDKLAPNQPLNDVQKRATLQMSGKDIKGLKCGELLEMKRDVQAFVTSGGEIDKKPIQS